MPQPVPKYLEREDVAKTRQQSEQESLRDRVIVEFMLSSGCRVGEVYGLNVDDLDLENRTVNVVGKGKKIRQVHFSEKCALLMETYLETHPRTQPALFISRKRTRLGIRMIQFIVQGIGEAAGIETRLHPHRFRHTFATELLAKGADLSFISDELGHADLHTTQRYAKLPKREIVSLYRKYMG